MVPESASEELVPQGGNGVGVSLKGLWGGCIANKTNLGNQVSGGHLLRDSDAGVLGEHLWRRRNAWHELTLSTEEGIS